MSTVSPFISGMGEDAVLNTRTLGARNAVTEWPLITWSDADIKLFVDEVTSRDADTDSGRITVKVLRGFVGGAVPVNHLDRITYHGEIFEVATIPTDEYLLGQLAFRKLELVQVTA